MIINRGSFKRFHCISNSFHRRGDRNLRSGFLILLRMLCCPKLDSQIYSSDIYDGLSLCYTLGMESSLLVYLESDPRLSKLMTRSCKILRYGRANLGVLACQMKYCVLVLFDQCVETSDKPWVYTHIRNNNYPLPKMGMA